MRKIINGLGAALFLSACVFVLPGCPVEGTDLPFRQPLTVKKNLEGRTTAAVCSIDVSLYNPLNAMDYTLADGVPFFDYVIFNAAELKKNGRWVSVEIPPYLRSVLERRYNVIIPFQRRGVRVLLGIIASPGISFGSLTKDDWPVLAAGIQDIIEQYGLDGVEIADTNGGSAYPDALQYPDPNDLAEAWRLGGDNMNNFLWKLRSILGDRGISGPAGRDRFPIIVREENYGRRLPVDVSATYFTIRDDQLTFAANPAFASFGTPGAATPGKSANLNLHNSSYAPLAANLGGDSITGTVVPPLEESSPGSGDSIFDFAGKFIAAKDYGLIYCRNLKPVSLAAAENFLDVPPAVQPKLGGKTRISQAEYLSIITRAVFGKDVVCHGGDRQ